MKKFAIICGSRTGSTYLCDMLSSTNRCGFPKEFFNKSMKFGDNKHEWIRKFQTENSVFGVKIVGFDQLRAFFDSNMQVNYLIWLYREDSILQAISRYIAYKTNGWHKKRERPEYSYEGIKWCLEEVEKENQFFEEYFEDKNHLKLSYEIDICDGIGQSVVSILQYMNITTEELPRIKSVRKTTEEGNNEWKVRFNEEQEYYSTQNR